MVRVIARLNVGGPALHVMNLTAGLEDHYRTLLVCGRIGPDEADLTPVAEQRNLPIEVVPALGREIAFGDDFRSFFSLYRLLRRVRPAIVHTHTAKAGTVGRLAALAAGVPVRVHTFHGHVFHGYFGRWKTKAFVMIERTLARISTSIVAISDQQADELAARYGICDRAKIDVIPLGLDLSAFSPDHRDALGHVFRDEIAAGEATVITCVGRLVPIKNHRLLLSALRILRDQGLKVVLAVVGGGSEMDSLRGLASDLGLSDCVRFLGWRHDLATIYAGTDVVALSSTNEGTPVCLIEALAAGCSVIATDVGGVRDVLEHGRLGTIVPPGDAAALAEGLAGLVNDPELRLDLGRRGAVAAKARFGVERLVRDIETLYDRLTRRPSVAS